MNGRGLAPGFELDAHFGWRVAQKLAVELHTIHASQDPGEFGGEGEGFHLAAFGVVDAGDGLLFDQQCLSGLDLDGYLEGGRPVDFKDRIANETGGAGHAEFELHFLGSIRTGASQRASTGACKVLADPRLSRGAG